MTQPLAGKQILIVEDEPVFRSLMHTWLASLGATIVQAHAGTVAVRNARDARIHGAMARGDQGRARTAKFELRNPAGFEANTG